MVAGAEQRTSRGAGRRRLTAIAVTVALIAVAFAFVLPKIAGYTAVWQVLHRLTWPWIAGLVGVTIANIFTFAPPWMVVLSGLGFWRALIMTQASTAFSLVVPGGAPIGMAASFAMLRSWGLSRRAVGLAVTLTGLWNQLFVFAFPVIAVVLLAAQGAGSHSLVVLALTGVTLLVAVTGGIAAVLGRPHLTYRVGQFAHDVASRFGRLRGGRPPRWDGESAVSIRAEALELLRGRWLALTAATFANQLTGYLMLELSLRSVGISGSEVSIVESFAAWSVGRLLASLPLTPGGIGVVELGLTGTLIGFGGPNARTVTAVIVYRGLSIVPTLLLGVLAALIWRMHDARASLQ
jgi:uncharacterized membrane protein YbhN (UPF0104 family)